MIKKCPHCGYAISPSALRCSCGYDFQTGQVSKIRADSDVQVDIGGVPKPQKRVAPKYVLTSVKRRNPLPILVKVCGILGLCLTITSYFAMTRPASPGIRVFSLVIFAFIPGVLLLICALTFWIFSSGVKKDQGKKTLFITLGVLLILFGVCWLSFGVVGLIVHDLTPRPVSSVVTLGILLTIGGVSVYKVSTTPIEETRGIISVILILICLGTFFLFGLLFFLFGLLIDAVLFGFTIYLSHMVLLGILPIIGGVPLFRKAFQKDAQKGTSVHSF